MNTAVEVPTEMHSHPVSHVLSFAWDGGDPWGSAMTEAFALCDFLTFELDAGERVPAGLGYVPAMGEPEREAFLFQELEDTRETFTTDDVVTYLELLDTFLDRCVATGLDY